LIQIKSIQDVTPHAGVANLAQPSASRRLAGAGFGKIGHVAARRIDNAINQSG
jgi:hypothetical protein